MIQDESKLDKADASLSQQNEGGLIHSVRDQSLESSQERINKVPKRKKKQGGDDDDKKSDGEGSKKSDKKSDKDKDENKDDDKDEDKKDGKDPDDPDGDSKKKEKKGRKDDQEASLFSIMLPNIYLLYQESITLHKIYTCFFFFLEILIFIYKGLVYQFPRNTIGAEIVGLIFYFLIQIIRFSWGTLGNRTQTSLYILFSIIWSIGALYTYFHFHLLQTFVLRIEIPISFGGFIVWLIEIVFGVFTMLNVMGMETGM